MGNNILSKISELFSNEESNVDMKTKDGNILRFSELKEGNAIVQLDEDGETQLENGEFEMEDGTKITVKDNKIESFSDATKPSAYLELPVGEHVIGDTRYIVEEVIENEGTENEYRKNVIVEMIPVGAESTEVSEEMEETEVSENFMDVETNEGVKLYIETQTEGELTVGDNVMIVESDEKSVATAGEYELTDGRTLVIGEEGNLVEVKEAEAEEEEQAEEAEMFKAVEDKLSNLLDKVAEFEAKVESLETKNKELKDEVAKFSGEPSATPTKTKVEFGKNDKQARLEFFAKR